MRKNVLFAIVFSCMALFGYSQFEVGHTTFTFNDPSRNGGFGSGGGPGRQIQTEIYYPADVAGDDVAVSNGTFPVVVFGHGFVMVWSAYENVWEDLVDKGYIIAFPRTEGALPDHEDFGLDLALVETKMQAFNSNSNSLFFEKISPNSAIMGHSMGGGATFIAAANNNSSTLKTVVGLAPAETDPSAIAAAANVSVDAVVFSGSSDNVTAPNSNHLPIYTALNSTCKTYISITNGSHCYFANSNFNCDFGEIAVGGSGSLSRGRQQDITNDFVGLWLAYKLKGSCTSFYSFQDSVATSSRITNFQSCNSNPTPSTLIIDTSICENDVYLSPSGMMFSSSNTFNDTLNNTNGCDSIIYTITLNVLSLDSTFENLSSCNPADVDSVSTTYTNQFGCDSVHTVETVLLPTATSNQNFEGCNSVTIDGVVYFQSITFSDTLTSAASNGCDSIVNYIVTVNQPSVVEIDTTICPLDSILLPNGSFALDSGTYNFTALNSLGCDSFITVNLHFSEEILVTEIVGLDSVSVNDTVTYFIPNLNSENSVSADVIGGVFLPSNANDTLVINWQNTGNFELLVSIFNGFCEENLTLPVNVQDTLTSIFDRRNTNPNFSIYPNPALNNLTIQFTEKPTKKVELLMYNTIGKLVKRVSTFEQKILLDVSTIQNGYYFIAIENKVIPFIKME